MNREAADRTTAAARPTALDVARVRADFPILESRVHGKPLVYLDSAASTQKPQAVIDAVRHYYEVDCSNVHRGVHKLSERATLAFERTRARAGELIGARDRNEIVFTSGTTGAINLVAHSYGSGHVGRGDEIVVTEMEHHSNIVPWQLLCERSGATLRVAPIDDSGTLMLDRLEELLRPRTRLVAVCHTSNALGTRNPLERIIEMAHSAGAKVLVDAAQAMAHSRIDVQALDCDFLALSGHKMHGPTGIGVLYGKAELLEAMPPFLGGGDMIQKVSFSGTTFKEPPHRFEAGTPDIAGVIGLGAAIDYLQGIGIERIGEHEHRLLDYATARIGGIPQVTLVGTAAEKGGILSFTVRGAHPHDVATALDLEGVAVRAGHHCAQPAMERFGLTATLRASLACYNTGDEIDVMIAALEQAVEVLT